MRINAVIIAALVAIVIISVASGRTYAQTQKKIIHKPVTTEVVDKDVIVQSGQYLEEIAALNDTTYQRIYDDNSQIVNPNLIYPGESLQIPGSNQQLPDRPMLVDDTAQLSPGDDSSISTQSTQPAATPITNNANVSTPITSASDNTDSQTYSSSIWLNLANCESGGDWSIDTGNGFYGGLQFTLSSWNAVGGEGYPNQASEAEQILLAEKLQAMQGWKAWPVCSVELGL